MLLASKCTCTTTTCLVLTLIAHTTFVLIVRITCSNAILLYQRSSLTLQHSHLITCTLSNVYCNALLLLLQRRDTDTLP
jgi:hypothetical protein